MRLNMALSKQSKMLLKRFVIGFMKRHNRKIHPNITTSNPCSFDEREYEGWEKYDDNNPPDDMGMVARNPKNHADQWYVARKYFEDNLEPA